MNDQRTSSFGFSDLWIMAGGLATSALTLLGVYALSKADKDFAVMGWYALFIIPAGAILVGLASGSGYGLLSWFSGRKVSGRLLAIILLLLIVTYGAAQWLEFQKLNLRFDDGRQVGFFEYYDATTRSMTFKMSHSKKPTGELGILGYLFRLLELAGFSAGGLIILLGLRSQPYCERCRAYMRKRATWWIPAAVPHRNINKKDISAKEAFDLEMKQAYERGGSAAERLLAAARERDVTRFQQLLADEASPKKPSGRLTHLFSLTLKACRHCADGELVSYLNVIQGNKSQTKKISSQRVDAGFVQALPINNPAPHS